MRFIILGSAFDYEEIMPSERSLPAQNEDICICSKVILAKPLNPRPIVSNVDWNHNGALIFRAGDWISEPSVDKVLKRCVESSGLCCYYFRLKSKKIGSLKMNKWFSEPLPLP